MTKNVRLSVQLSGKRHQKLKTFAAIYQTTMTEIIDGWIDKYLPSKNIPNEETLEAIRQCERGEGLREIDLDDLLK